MKSIVYNQEGKEIGEVLLPKEIFDVDINTDLVHQVAVSQAANKRVVLADTKGRGEVRGGGRKPWRQKGTGRARHGSRRSPLWRGGGITFGPTSERVFEKKINRKMRKKALFMVLSAKSKGNLVVVLDSIKLEKPKTKLMAGILKKLPVKDSFLMVLPQTEKEFFKAARNIANLEVRKASDLNVLDLLSSKYFILPKEEIKSLKETFLKEE